MEQTVSAEALSVMMEAGALHKENKASAHVLYLVILRSTSQRSYKSVKGTKKKFIT
jgi:hypothetical protein